jgi:hypothetical protein
MAFVPASTGTGRLYHAIWDKRVSLAKVHLAPDKTPFFILMSDLPWGSLAVFVPPPPFPFSSLSFL